MELNTKGRYAVMAMADLAANSVSEADDSKPARAVPLSAVAERQQLSLAYLEQIFLLLRRKGLVESARGRSGGYRLAREAREISIAEIMAAVDEETRMTRCDVETGPCLGDIKCSTHGLWHALGQHIETFLNGVTLADVISERFKPGAHLAEAVQKLDAAVTGDNKVL